MKQTQAFLSTYTADVSGVCSALFELGGMTVMHDASGCNSTYNTHDEPRWYDMDSLVFISGLSELEAVLGDDEKLIEDTVRAAKKLSPRFIALAGNADSDDHRLRPCRHCPGNRKPVRDSVLLRSLQRHRLVCLRRGTGAAAVRRALRPSGA